MDRVIFFSFWMDCAVRPFVPCQSVASPVGQLSADEAKVGACPVSAESVRDARTSGHRTPRTTMLCRAHGYNHLITVTSPTHEALEHGPSLLSLSLSLPIGRISIAVVWNALATRSAARHVTGTTDNMVQQRYTTMLV
jgi:hypothetical protein